MPDITEVIDNAVRDYSVSGDAMRWTPEPPGPPRIPGVWPLPNDVVVRFELELAPFLDALERARASVRALGEAAERAGSKVAWCVLDETRTARDAKRERMRRLHTAYRAKRGKRW
jgi:hypothetical protein